MATLTDTITIHSYRSHGSARFTIWDEPVEKLIEYLHEQGIMIERSASERKVMYRLTAGKFLKSEQVIVPLSAEFPDGCRDLAFYLRDGKGLELEVTNYKSKDHGPRYPAESIDGVACILTQTTQHPQELDPTLIPRATEALKLTYDKGYRSIKENPPRIDAAKLEGIASDN